jgi:transcriptional regulator with XRE-family HTH domain
VLTAKQPEIGKLIRELRQAMGLTQEQFAAKLGVTFPTIDRWENGRSQPSPLARDKIFGLFQQMNPRSNESSDNTSPEPLTATNQNEPGADAP